MSESLGGCDDGKREVMTNFGAFEMSHGLHGWLEENLPIEYGERGYVRVFTELEDGRDEYVFEPGVLLERFERPEGSFRFHTDDGRDFVVGFSCRNDRGELIMEIDPFWQCVRPDGFSIDDYQLFSGGF